MPNYCSYVTVVGIAVKFCWSGYEVSYCKRRNGRNQIVYVQPVLWGTRQNTRHKVTYSPHQANEIVGIFFISDHPLTQALITDT